LKVGLLRSRVDRRKGVSMPTDDDGIRAIKAARNQALCREVNERIEAATRGTGDLELLCECANLECTETLIISGADYERIRSSPVRFPVKPGHDFPEWEDVVEENTDYVIVQKHGKAAEVADHLDPRSR
jgi:hypothetical protein